MDPDWATGTMHCIICSSVTLAACCALAQSLAGRLCPAECTRAIRGGIRCKQSRLDFLARPKVCCEDHDFNKQKCTWDDLRGPDARSEASSASSLSHVLAFYKR